MVRTSIRAPFTIADHGDHFAVAGTIDETSSLQLLVDQARNGELVLDLANVTFINSLGVREWMRMQSTARQLGLNVELRRVAEPIVHQLNMIIATRGTARVTSFYAPYACDACSREESVLVDAVQNAQLLTQMRPPSVLCPGCQREMAFDDFPERYFSFLSTH